MKDKKLDETANIFWNYDISECPVQELVEVYFEFNNWGMDVKYPYIFLLYIQDENRELYFSNGDSFEDATLEDVIAWREAHLPEKENNGDAE